MINHQKWNAESVQAAFEIFIELLEKGECDFEKNHAFKLNYNDPEVFEILKEVIEPTAKVRIFENSFRAIYIMPNADNTFLTYKDSELRKEIGLESNSELYFANFVMLILLSKFNNDNEKRLYLQMEEFINSIDEYMKTLENNIDEEDFYKEEYGVNIRRMMDVWGDKKLSNTNFESIAKSKKTKLGFLVNILKFYAKEGLIELKDNYTSIWLTEKMKRIVNDYYTDESNQKGIIRFIEDLETL